MVTWNPNVEVFDVPENCESRCSDFEKTSCDVCDEIDYYMFFAYEMRRAWCSSCQHWYHKFGEVMDELLDNSNLKT